MRYVWLASPYWLAKGHYAYRSHSRCYHSVITMLLRTATPRTLGASLFTDLETRVRLWRATGPAVV